MNACKALLSNRRVWQRIERSAMSIPGSVPCTFTCVKVHRPMQSICQRIDRSAMSTPQGSVIVKPLSSEDLCLVAPHPDLQRRLLERYNEIKDDLASSSELSLLSTVLRPTEQRPPGFNDGLLRPGDTFPPGMPFAAQLAADRAPLHGDVNVILVMVDFEDSKFSDTQTQEHYAKIWFEENSNSVRDYYHDVSNRAVNIKGKVVGPYTMTKKLAEYANHAKGMGKEAPNARTMARDAAAAAVHANPEVNFKTYDNDGDGYVDAFVIVHAGKGAEITGNVGDIWSHQSGLENGPYQADGTKLYAYLTVPADCKLGVCAHEFGHLAFGWPDLYDADYSSSGIGNWCLMAGGSYNGKELNPAEPCAWCKVNQGWVEVITPTESGKVELRDVKIGHQVLKLWKDGAPDTEYFLVENRQQKGRDEDLPGGGLLLWHIDERISNNNSEQTHYKVALVQSDGKNNLQHKAERGDKGDPFPGSPKKVRLVNAFTTPSTNANNGAPTGVEISNISDPGSDPDSPPDVMTFTVSFGVY